MTSYYHMTKPFLTKTFLDKKHQERNTCRTHAHYNRPRFPHCTLSNVWLKQHTLCWSPSCPHFSTCTSDNVVLRIRHIHACAYMSTACMGKKGMSGGCVCGGWISQVWRCFPARMARPWILAILLALFPRPSAGVTGMQDLTQLLRGVITMCFKCPSHFLCSLYTLILFFCSIFCLLTWFYCHEQHFRFLRTPEFNSLWKQKNTSASCVLTSTGHGGMCYIIWYSNKITDCISPAFWRHNYLKHHLWLL